MKKAIVRLVVLGVLIINQVLTTMGWYALPFSDDQIYEGVSSVATVVMTLWTYWKNNNLTPEAEQAQKELDRKKRKKKSQLKKQEL